MREREGVEREREAVLGFSFCQVVEKVAWKVGCVVLGGGGSTSGVNWRTHRSAR